MLLLKWLNLRKSTKRTSQYVHGWYISNKRIKHRCKGNHGYWLIRNLGGAYTSFEIKVINFHVCKISPFLGEIKPYKKSSFRHTVYIHATWKKYLSKEKRSGKSSILYAYQELKAYTDDHVSIKSIYEFSSKRHLLRKPPKSTIKWLKIISQ